jgi:hypothetical protein
MPSVQACPMPSWSVTDVDYRIETSSDLRTWTLSNDRFDRVSSFLLEGGNEEVTYLSQTGVTALTGGQFVRVRVQLRE